MKNFLFFLAFLIGEIVSYPIPYSRLMVHDSKCVGFTQNGQLMVSSGTTGWLKVHQLSSAGYVQRSSLQGTLSCGYVRVSNNGHRIVVLDHSDKTIKYYSYSSKIITLMQTISMERLSVSENADYIIGANHDSPFQIIIFKWTNSTTVPYKKITSTNQTTNINQVQITKKADKILVRLGGKVKLYSLSNQVLTLQSNYTDLCADLNGPFSMEATSDFSTIVFGCNRGISVYYETSQGYTQVQSLHNSFLTGSGAENYIVEISGNGDYIFFIPMCSDVDKGMIYNRKKDALTYQFLQDVDTIRKDQCCYQFTFTQSGHILSILCNSLYLLKFQCLAPNCQLCSYRASQCLKCNPKFILNQKTSQCQCNITNKEYENDHGSCSVCQEPCLSCASNGKCNKCMEGYNNYYGQCILQGQNPVIAYFVGIFIGFSLFLIITFIYLKLCKKSFRQNPQNPQLEEQKSQKPKKQIEPSGRLPLPLRQINNIDSFRKNDNQAIVTVAQLNMDTSSQNQKNNI